MTLLASFTHPVADAQSAFRRLLKAMSEPGVMVAMPLAGGWGPLSGAATSLLLTLLDHDTSLYLSPSFDLPVIQDNLRFHTGTVLTDSTQQALFALLDVDHCQHDRLSGFPIGDEEAPHQSATLIVELPHLHGGLPLRLSGPGIPQQRTISPCLPEGILHWLTQSHPTFPLGLDFIFTCGDSVIAIPRSTQVETK